MTEIIGIVQTVVHDPVRREERIQTKALLAQREDGTTVWDHTHPGQTSLRELDDQALDALRRVHPATYGAAVVGEQERRHLVDVVARQDAAMAAHEAEMEKRDAITRRLESEALKLRQDAQDAGFRRADLWNSSGTELIERCASIKDEAGMTHAQKLRFLSTVQDELAVRRTEGCPEHIAPRRHFGRIEP